MFVIIGYMYKVFLGNWNMLIIYCFWGGWIGIVNIYILIINGCNYNLMRGFCLVEVIGVD